MLPQFKQSKKNKPNKKTQTKSLDRSQINYIPEVVDGPHDAVILFWLHIVASPPAADKAFCL